MVAYLMQLPGLYQALVSLYNASPPAFLMLIAVLLYITRTKTQEIAAEITSIKGTVEDNNTKLARHDEQLNTLTSRMDHARDERSDIRDDIRSAGTDSETDHNRPLTRDGGPRAGPEGDAEEPDQPEDSPGPPPEDED